MSTLRIGTPVMVVRTGTELDGSTREVTGLPAWRFGLCGCCGLPAVCRGYDVTLARSVGGLRRWSITREHLIPLFPPDATLVDGLIVVRPLERLAA